MKKFYLSKTMWVALILAILANVSPDVRAWVAANPDYAVSILSVVFLALRTVTKGKLDFGFSDTSIDYQPNKP